MTFASLLRPPATALLLAASLALAASPAAARLVEAELAAKEGDPAGPSALANLNAPFTDGQGRLGFTFSLSAGGWGVWHGAGPVWLSEDAAPDLVTGGESTMGVGDDGEFIYSPSVNGEDAVWREAGAVLVGGSPAPELPPGTTITFCSRPQMIDDGTASWISGFDDGVARGRALYRSQGGGPVVLELRTGDAIEGLTIVASDGVGFDYQFSGDGAHHAHSLILDDGGVDREAVSLDGRLHLLEGGATGDGDAWAAFDQVSVNAAGRVLVSGNTDGAIETDEFLAVDGAIVLREGDTIDGVVLASGATVQAASLNDLGQAVHAWRVNGGDEHLFFAPDAADPRSGTVLLSTGDELDVDGDGVADFLVTDLTASGAIGPGLDFAEDGGVFVGVDLEPAGGGTEFEAILRFATADAPRPDQLLRSSVADLVPGWQDGPPLPLTPASALDPGWPLAVERPGTLQDLGVVAEGAPLVLYLLLDADGAAVDDALRVEKGPGPDDLSLSF